MNSHCSAFLSANSLAFLENEYYYLPAIAIVEFSYIRWNLFWHNMIRRILIALQLCMDILIIISIDQLRVEFWYINFNCMLLLYRIDCFYWWYITTLLSIIRCTVQTYVDLLPSYIRWRHLISDDAWILCQRQTTSVISHLICFHPECFCK